MNPRPRLQAKAIGALAFCIALSTSPAEAHHSFAMFDNGKEVILDGTVLEFQWTNPHIWVQLMVLEDGKAVQYSIEGQSPNALARRGWTRNSLHPGDQVKLVMHPLKDGAKGGSFVRATGPDGKTLT